MIKYLLDTNIVIYAIKNRPEQVREKFNTHDGQMAISSVTLMELLYGAEKSTNPERNLDFGAHAAQHTGQIRAELARSGRPIGPYDQMIAGHARSLGLIVVTNNEREFQRVSGLRAENWV